MRFEFKMLGASACTALSLFTGLATAQTYPAKVIRFVTAAPGSANDYVARLIAQDLSRALGQQVIVENRASLAPEVVAKSPPDGYTILLNGSSTWLLPLMRRENYDPLEDLAPVTMAVTSPNILVVHPSMPVKSVKELIALAKAQPGKLNYAAGTLGAPPHLSSELFNAMAGVNIVRISYKGTGPSVIALVAGEVHLMFAGLGSVAPHIASGRLRALASTSAKTSALAPQLPTVAATLPGYEAETLIGIFAPAKTPAAIVTLLNTEIARVLNRVEIKEQLTKSGIEVLAGSQAAAVAIMKSDMGKMGKVIRESGIRAD